MFERIRVACLRSARTGLRWRTALADAALGQVVASSPARAAEPLYPRLANMYLQSGYDPGDIPSLARWDLLILDPAWKHADLQQLRQLNPNIKIYFYVCPYCLQVPPPGDAWRQANYNYATTNDLWWRNWNSTI